VSGQWKQLRPGKKSLLNNVFLILSLLIIQHKSER
jgi:hypothetical protein